MTSINLKCDCGAVTGTATDLSPSSGNRIICCCSDCQAFAAHLKREQDVLDEFGGTEIYQCTPSQISIEQGHDKLQSMRLTKKGLLRWHTSCCNTPVANTVKAGLPFVGLIHSFMEGNSSDRDPILGPVKTAIQTQHTKGSPTYPDQSLKFPLGMTAGIIKNMLVWKIQGKHKPNAFFSSDGLPVVKPVIAAENL